jgi:arylsulfatase A
MQTSSNKLFGLGLTGLGLLGFSGCGKQSSVPPNFIIILVDDLGSQDVGVYGQKYIETPNIDRLAAEGMIWTNAYSSCPVCSPTRVALLTGKNQARVGFTGHITAIGRHRYPENSRIIPPNDLMDLPHDEVILPRALKPAGYTSISIGKWHVGREGHWPVDLGFDENVGGWTHGSPPSFFYPYVREDSPWNPSIPTLEGGEPGEYLTDRETNEAIKFIKKNKDRQFLVYLPHYAVHTPLEAPHELIDKYEPLVEGTKIDPVYAAMVERVDWNVGRIMQTLEELDLSDNTVVIFTSDNGALKETGGRSVADLSPFRSGKGNLYEGGIRVPLIMRWPGHITPGTVSENPAISEDIYATVVDIAGHRAEPNTPLDGRSLVNDFKGTLSDTTIKVRWYYPHYSPHGNKPGAAIRSGDYKLLEFYDPPLIELYNLRDDIGETNDLSELLPEVKEELLYDLHEWLKNTSAILHTLNPEYKPE